MKWITNCNKEDADNYINDLRRGHMGRKIYIRWPKATETHSEKELSDMGMVGLYE